MRVDKSRKKAFRPICSQFRVVQGKILDKIRRFTMSATDKSTVSSKTSTLSLDTWAVIVALLLALAVKIGVFKTVPW